MNKFFRLPFELNPFYSYSVLCQPNKENWKVTAFNWIGTISDEEKLELVKKMTDYNVLRKKMKKQSKNI